ncbi:jerky protein homolog-like [Schistocerca serialis cubense]|uniref:jerky protein homolog-like n=1 Tax=Schistocerca serialis cubense TaxID=2023355 RepID=UPI00214EA262|nr:jerky protein homolog-like [Schistocerca serialis cubense]
MSGPILQEKALKFRNKLNEANFEAVQLFRNKLHKSLDKENLTGSQIFNCDETGVNYKMLPDKTLASKAEKAAPGYKRSKERVTILACSNATANLKMKLSMIDIFKEWFFNEFVPQTEKFLSANNLTRIALLLLDNATCHPNEDEFQDQDIKAMFLPPNVTSLCQRMDQGTLETLKRNYCRNLLSSLINAMDKGEDMLE